MHHLPERFQASFTEILTQNNVIAVPKGLSFLGQRISATLPEVPFLSENEIPELEKKYNIGQDLREQMIEEQGSQAAYNAWLLDGDQTRRRTEYVGGVGVTDRTYAQVIEQNPSLKRLLEEVTGNVIILGNGLSSLPLELLEKNSDITHITIVDIFDIDVTIAQLKKITSLLGAEKSKFVLELTNWQNLLGKMQKHPNITFLSAIVGRDSLEDRYGNYDYVINIKGPKNVGHIAQRLLRNENATIIQF
jgi:hypothetical protein